MTDRFDVLPIVRGHFKGLKNRDYQSGDERPVGTVDWVAIGILYGLPLLLGILSAWRCWNISSGDSLIAGTSILAGGLLASFSQLAAWRDRLTERAQARRASEVAMRDNVDSAVSHVCVAIAACIAMTVELIIGGNSAATPDELGLISSAVALALGLYIVLLIVMILSCLYAAYVEVNEVDDDLSGGST